MQQAGAVSWDDIAAIVNRGAAASRFDPGFLQASSRTAPQFGKATPWDDIAAIVNQESAAACSHFVIPSRKRR
ncbi:hypothetical protein [Beijerinckia indica]|nr:hypothetical protein [Beijerinckia indica]